VAEVKESDQIRTGDNYPDPAGNHDEQDARPEIQTPANLGPHRDRGLAPGRVDLPHGVRHQTADGPGSGDENIVENAVEIEVSKPKKQRVSRLKNTGEQGAKIIPLLTSEQRKKQNAKSQKTGRIKDLLTSEQIENEQAAEWLKYSMPASSNGWWEVRPEGRGFTVKFRWRAGKIQTQPFPRVSRKQYQRLQEVGRERAKQNITERIAGHLEDCLFDPRKRDKASVAASRLGLRIGNYQNAMSGN
jgi:hypothetical protein